MRTLILAALACVTIACTSSEDAVRSLNSKWVGRSVDEFVAQYGFPSGQYMLQDGGSILAWGSHNSFEMPSSTTTTGNFNANTGYFTSTTTNSGGGSVPVDCDLQLTVGPDRIIRSFRVMRDTWGVWQTSRCNEIFG
jgi:hypothetical protein